MLGCVVRLLMVGLLLVVLAVAWFFREPLMERGRAMIGREEAPATPVDLTESATTKIERLVSGDAGGTVALSEAEVKALVENRLGPFIPEYVRDPKVALNAGRVELSARLPTSEVPQMSELGPAAAFLPDTAQVTAVGQLVPVDRGRVALAVDEVTIAKVPLPRRMIPGLVERLRRGNQQGVPRDAIAFPLPPNVTGAYVRGDSLVLQGGPPADANR